MTGGVVHQVTVAQVGGRWQATLLRHGQRPWRMWLGPATAHAAAGASLAAEFDLDAALSRAGSVLAQAGWRTGRWRISAARATAAVTGAPVGRVAS